LRTTSECPTLHPTPFIELARRLPGKRRLDITGVARGSMVIVGFVEMDKGVNKSVWAARCGCGKYETRRYWNYLSGAVKGWGDSCEECYMRDNGVTAEQQVERQRMLRGEPA